MSSLAAVLDTLAPEGGAFAIDAPGDWGQGRTLYGGMTAALTYEAVRRAHADLAPLRSAQFTFVGPASGRLRFTSSVLRRGRSSTLIGADGVNDDGHVARALFAFGAGRESKVSHDFLPRPAAPAPATLPPFRNGGGAPSRGFWNNFETRLASGGRLFDRSATRPEFAVWTRFLDVGAADPTTALLALADCLPPAAMVMFPEPGPISTITWTVDVAQIPRRLDGWFLLWAASEHAGEGYSLQNMAMWGEAGALIATGRQTIAIFV